MDVCAFDVFEFRDENIGLVEVFIAPDLCERFAVFPRGDVVENVKDKRHAHARRFGRALPASAEQSGGKENENGGKDADHFLEIFTLMVVGSILTIWNSGGVTQQFTG